MDSRDSYLEKLEETVLELLNDDSLSEDQKLLILNKALSSLKLEKTL